MRWATKDDELAFRELRALIVQGEEPGAWRFDPNEETPRFIQELGQCCSGAYYRGKYRVPVWIFKFGAVGGVPEFLLARFEDKCRAAKTADQLPTLPRRES